MTGGFEYHQTDHDFENKNGQHAIERRKMQRALGDLPGAVLLIDYTDDGGGRGGHGQRGQQHASGLGQGEPASQHIDRGKSQRRFDEAGGGQPGIGLEPGQIDPMTGFKQDQAKRDIGQQQHGWRGW